MKISPQLVMTGKLLQAPGAELEEWINKELADNPALELTSRSTVTPTGLRVGNVSRHAGSKDFSSYEEFVENIAQRQSPLEKLAEQVSFARNQTDRDIALYLLHRLDHRGFLVVSIEQLATELGTSQEVITPAIQLLHHLEPPGIGARDLRECFLIQCDHLEAEGTDCRRVRRILTLAWTEFLTQHWDRVARKIREPKSAVEEACEFMRRNLDPHPLAIVESAGESEAILEYADLIIRRDQHSESPSYWLEVPGEEEFQLSLSTSYQELLGPQTQEKSPLYAHEQTWLKLHLDRAGLLINALRQRWETLRRIGTFLIQHQCDFLEKGLLYLKPFTRAAVAQELNVHESTISRAVRDKVVQLPDGHRIPLSDLFDPSLPAKEAIRRFVKAHRQPLCDREIAKGLQSQGIHLARRTVTKYRREIALGASRPQSMGM